MGTERPKDFWDEIIDNMPDTHGSHDHFDTTRAAVRWAMGQAVSGIFNPNIAIPEEQ